MASIVWVRIIIETFNVLPKSLILYPLDLSQREGKYPVPPQAPKTLGVEFSGYVSSLGPSVSDFKKGDEVFGLAYGGVGPLSHILTS